MPVFLAGGAGAGGSPTCCGTTWGAAWCHQPAPSPQHPRLWGPRWALPRHLPADTDCLGSSAQEGIPPRSSSCPAQMFPKHEEAELVSCTPVARSCAGGEPHFPDTDNHKGKFKGKSTYSHLEELSVIAHCEPHGHPLKVSIAWECRRGDRNPKGGSCGSTAFFILQSIRFT